MTPLDWKRIRHFGPGEAWGEPDRMDFAFVFLLDAFRDFIGKPIVISTGTQGVHVETSLHYLGRAVDVVFPGFTESQVLELFIAASRFEFSEIGLYAGWTYEGKPVAGMHLGYSEPPANEVARKHYWIGTRKIGADGTPARVPLTEQNLRAQGLLVA